MSDDDLPYRIELWDVTARAIESIVALTASPTIGYAAYYAATREHPGRIITLRHDGRIVSRWSPTS
jgi:hypothetical protein